MMSDDNDAEMITKDEKVNEELAQVKKATCSDSENAVNLSRISTRPAGPNFMKLLMHEIKLSKFLIV